MSTVIKAGDTMRNVTGLRTVNLTDYLEAARAHVERAKDDAARLMVEAKREGKKIFAEVRRVAHEEGYRAGHEEGTEAGHRAAFDEATERFNVQQAGLVESLNATIAQVEGMKDDLAVTSERQVLELAVMIARKLTFEIGTLHHESAFENFRRAMRLIGSKTDLTIRIHPDDLSALETFAKSSLAKVGASKSFRFLADDTMAAGGCKVEAECASVDATLETQVGEIVSMLLGIQNDDA